MSPHPVQLRVELPPQWSRVHVLIRLMMLITLGAIGFSSVYWVL